MFIPSSSACVSSCAITSCNRHVNTQLPGNGDFPAFLVSVDDGDVLPDGTRLELLPRDPQGLLVHHSGLEPGGDARVDREDPQLPEDGRGNPLPLRARWTRLLAGSHPLCREYASPRPSTKRAARA